MTPASRREAEYERANIASAEWIISRPDLYEPDSGPAVWARLVLARVGAESFDGDAAIAQRPTGAQGGAFQRALDFEGAAR